MRVKVKNRLWEKRHLYAASVQSKYRYIEGDVIDTPKWVEYPALTIRTGPKRYDFSIIDLAVVVEQDGEAFTAPIQKPSAKVVKVKGSKGDIYTVTVGDKHNSCTCHAFQFRRSCKHIKQVLEAV